MKICNPKPRRRLLNFFLYFILQNSYFTIHTSKIIKNQRIYIVGMPGSGKSTWGKKLANALNYTFVDLDKLIEQSEMISIEDIFQVNGEEYFRTLEHKYIKKTMLLDRVVISCGGGTPCFNNNMNLINENGISFYLKGNNGLLAERILNSKSLRPMFMRLDRASTEKKIEELLLIRTVFFDQAHYTFKIPQESVQSFVNKAIKLISSVH